MSKEDWKENNLTTLFNLPSFDSVLDIGCGLALKSKYINAPIRVGVDIYEPYLKKIDSEVPYVVIKHDIRDLSVFLDKSFDLVIACDVIEHLTKEEGLRLVAACERIARKAVIFETPLGFIPQNIDILGFEGHEFQTHRSGWQFHEFQSLGYTVTTREYQMTNVKRHTDLDVPTGIHLIEAIKWLPKVITSSSPAPRESSALP